MPASLTDRACHATFVISACRQKKEGDKYGYHQRDCRTVRCFRGTVDRVLNNRGSVSSKTAEKVLEIAKALDYRPNRAGLTLAAQKKTEAGSHPVWQQQSFFDEVMKGVRYQEERLAGYNCSILVRQISYDVSGQLAAIEELLSQEVHGIVLAPLQRPGHRSIKKNQCPV